MKFQGRQNARLLAAMMVTSLVVTSHAWQPVYRTRRRYRPEVPVRVRAFPHDVTLYPGSSVSVRCRIRVASWALKSLHVGFYVSHCVRLCLELQRTKIASSLSNVFI